LSLFKIFIRGISTPILYDKKPSIARKSLKYNDNPALIKISKFALYIFPDFRYTLWALFRFQPGRWPRKLPVRSRKKLCPALVSYQGLTKKMNIEHRTLNVGGWAFDVRRSIVHCSRHLKFHMRIPRFRSGIQPESLVLKSQCFECDGKKENPEPCVPRRSLKSEGGNPEPQHMEVCMDKWECPCGYVYDPEEGDAENNIQVGTPFEELPDDWVCPLCGAEKEYFEKVE
jgi:rubredoxin